MKLHEKTRTAPEASTPRSSKSRWRRISRKIYMGVGILVLLLVVGRLALPYAIKSYVNRQLNRPGDYTGSVGDISVHLWRGAYRIHGIGIFKRTGEIKEPFFSAHRLDLSIQWKELFHGSVVGEVEMEQPRLNFVSGPTEETTQTGKGAGWDEILKSLFPFKLNRLQIKNGEVHFANHYSKPAVDISISQFYVLATNLTNARDLKSELPSGVVARGKTFGAGSVDVDLRLNLLAAKPTYELTFQLTNVNLVALNDFLLAYGKFDVARGTFGLFASVASKEGNYEGYFKPVIENLEVFNWQKEKDKNVFGVVWEAIVGMVGTVFRNHSRDTVATKVPIAGTYEKSDVGVWTAVVNLLRNAFVQALVPKVDEKVTVRDAEKKSSKPDAKVSPASDTNKASATSK